MTPAVEANKVADGERHTSPISNVCCRFVERVIGRHRFNVSQLSFSP
jgi:hypothetical protein